MNPLTQQDIARRLVRLADKAIAAADTTPGYGEADPLLMTAQCCLREASEAIARDRPDTKAEGSTTEARQQAHRENDR